MENQYYEVVITNREKERLDYVANVDIHLTGALLNNPNNYRMIIQKFSIDGEALPISIIELKQPQTPKTQDWETIHNVYIVNSSGTVASANVLFNTERLPNNPPKPVKIEAGLGYYDNKDRYFFLYRYTYLIRKINEALEIAYSQLYSDTNYPRFVYDPKSQLITLFAPSSIFSYDLPNPARFYFSMSLYKYVGEGFAGPFVMANTIPGITENTYSIDITANSIKDTDSDSTFLAIPQEYIAITSFSTINSILISSNNLPVRKEYFPSNPHSYLLSGDKTNAESYSSMSSFPILCKFYPNSFNAGDFRGKIIYSNNSIEVGDLIDFQSSRPLREMNISVHFVDNYNNIYPLTLIPGKSVSITIAFIKIN